MILVTDKRSYSIYSINQALGLFSTGRLMTRLSIRPFWQLLKRKKIHILEMRCTKYHRNFNTQ